MRHALTALLATAALAGSAPARAADVAVGAGLAMSVDLPDAVSDGHTRFTGGHLKLPAWIGLGPSAALRVAPSLDFAAGRDRVTWSVPVNSDTVRFMDDDHLAVLLSAGVTVGPDLTLPVDTVNPYLGVGAGAAWVGTYHALRGPAAAALLDPAQNDLENPGNVDPFSSQLAWLTELRGGVRPAVGDRVAVWFETGYSVAFLGAGALRKTPEEVDAQREPYGWNALRLGAGLAVTL